MSKGYSAKIAWNRFIVVTALHTAISREVVSQAALAELTHARYVICMQDKWLKSAHICFTQTMLSFELYRPSDTSTLH